VCKKSIKNSQPFVRKMRNVRTPWGGGFIHTVCFPIGDSL